MIKKDILIEEANKDALWALEMRISKQNKKLLDLAGQGVDSKNKQWLKIVRKRNILRKVLINKLNVWTKGDTSDSNPSYSDYLKALEWRKERELEEYNLDKVKE